MERAGFDLPIKVDGNLGGGRKILYDNFIGDGLDQVLSDVVGDDRLKNYLINIVGPKLRGAGELSYLANICGVSDDVQFSLHVRNARRLQISLIPKNVSGKKWIRKTFNKFGLYPLHRADDRFTPICWWGALNMISDSESAVLRAIKFCELIQKLHSSTSLDSLADYQYLLSGLPKRAT